MDHDAADREPSDAIRVELDEQVRTQLEKFRVAHKTQVLTILFSDLEGSTRQQSDLGNIRAAELVRVHRGLFREVLGAFVGEEVETAGDSFLCVFAAPSEGVNFALHLQAAMRKARTETTELPAVRVGIHQGQVVTERYESGAKPLDIYGIQVSTAARIMDLGQGGQILCSRAVFDDARAILRTEDFGGLGSVAWRNHGPYRFKGVEDAYDVCEVGEADSASLEPPPATTKSWPADHAEEELGWRPAAGALVPETNWTLEEKLGQGEFGEVWKAFNRSDKSHQVFKFCFKRERVPALKREARLLKRLRKYAHPSLVEVYDVTEGDRPPHFLEMEYVEGPSLAEWLADEPPRTERLEIVAQIADALDTVHAAGIYHRDIKPTNILLTRREDGQLLAKLADFGLGAAEDTELLRSIQASRVEGVAGTWDYLAPELREGNSASAQTDIYSLGVTLYQIVTGGLERPLAADWEAQLENEVLRDDVRRCVARRPGDRWPRAGELATALRGHDQRLERRALEREREEQRRRAQRLRRVAVVVALFALVSVGFGGFAVTQWFEARAQRDRAVQQKRLALEAVNRLTHDVPNRLKDVPGALGILRETMEQNVEILDRILALEPDTPFARREKGVNYVNIGDRWLLLGETEKAAEAFDSALAIAGELAGANPDERHYQEDLYIAYERVGKVRLAQGKTNSALNSYLAARQTANRLLNDYGDTDARLTMSYAWNHESEAYEALGQKRKAKSMYEWSLENTQELHAEDPENRDVLRTLSISYEKVGDINLDLGRPDEALAAYAAGMELAEVRLASEPNSIEAQRDVALGYDDLGMTYLRLGRPDDALAAFEASIELSISLAEAAPDNVLAQRDLAVSYDRLGDVYQQVGRADDALAAFEAGLAIAEQRLAADPANAEAQHDIVAGYQKLGNAYLALERVEDALEVYRTARAHAKRAADADAGSAEARRNFSVCCNKVGDALAGSSRFAEALTAYQEGLPSAQAVAELDPGSTEAHRDLGISQFKLMIAHRLLEDVPSWREAGALCVEQFERAFELAPHDPRSKQDLMGVLSEYSLGLLVNTEVGGPDMQEALELAQRLNALSEDTDPNHLDILALAYLMTANATKAAATQQKALDLLPADADYPALIALRERFQSQLEAYQAAIAPTPGESE